MTSWLQKLGLGLKKSSSRLSSGISDIFTKRKIDDATLEELEELLITSDMGVKASSKIVDSLSRVRVDKSGEPEEIRTRITDVVSNILKPCEKDFAIEGSPCVILMVGVNGAGKTTTVGKLAARFIGKKISFIAADTFRAAAVEQLSVWGERNNIRVIKGAPGCDAAGLCFDGLQEALRQNDDIVFIDTAGRLQNKTGLMDELRKIVKVIKKSNTRSAAPHLALPGCHHRTKRFGTSQSLQANGRGQRPCRQQTRRNRKRRNFDSHCRRISYPDLFHRRWRKHR